MKLPMPMQVSSDEAAGIIITVFTRATGMQFFLAFKNRSTQLLAAAQSALPFALTKGMPALHLVFGKRFCKALSATRKIA